MFLQGRGNCGPNDGPQTAGVQAVLGFPAQSGVNNTPKLLVWRRRSRQKTSLNVDENETKINRFVFIFFSRPPSPLPRPLWLFEDACAQELPSREVRKIWLRFYQQPNRTRGIGSAAVLR